MTDDNLAELLEYVRAARSSGGAKGVTREQKITLLRKHGWHRVKRGKGERWQSSDGGFYGTLHDCHREQQRRNRAGENRA